MTAVHGVTPLGSASSVRGERGGRDGGSGRGFS